MPSLRWQAVRLRLLTCGLILAVGCASNPLAGRFRGSEREPVLTDTDQTNDEEDTPPRQRPRSKKITGDEDGEQVASKQREPKPSTDGKPLDPATRMLIDSELKELPSDERRIWKEYLASVAPDAVPQILQKRIKGEVPSEIADQLEATSSSPTEEPASATRKLAKNKTPSASTNARDLPNQEDLDSTSDLSNPDILLTGNEIAEEAQERDASEFGVSLKRPIDNDDEALPQRGKARDALTNEAETPLHEQPAENQAPLEQTALAPREETGTERRMMDQMRIWPQGKRPERSLQDRLTGPLTPPWSRENRTSPPEKESRQRSHSARANEPSAVKSPIDSPATTDPNADYWQDELRKLISLMEAEAARPPEDDSPAERQAHIQRQVYLRMLYLMAAEPEKAQLPIDNVNAVDQEFWTSMFWGMSNYFDDEQTGDPGLRAAQTIAQLNAAARQLQMVADLELRNVGFCQKIDGWGLYERFDHDEFKPGQEVLLYGELRNFDTEATAAGYYRTLIGSTIEIVRTGQEESVLDRHDLGNTEDLCRGLRTDFYNSYRLTLPAHLTRGSYQLRLTVEDQISGRLATQTIGFTIR